jgi:hypothetical protein
LGYGHHVYSLEIVFRRLRLMRLGIAPRASWGPDLPGPRPTRLPREQPTPGSAYPSASSLRWPTTSWVGRPRRAFLSKLGSAGTRTWWYWNINQLSIDYAFRPRLRSRLTLGGRAFPRNPWTFGGGDSHSSFATHAGILTRAASTVGFRHRFTARSTLPYRSRRLGPSSRRRRGRA